jgi:hypothetical protein
MPFTISCNGGRPTTVQGPTTDLDYCWDLTNVIDVGDTILSVTWQTSLTSPGAGPLAGATLTTGSIINTASPKSNLAYGWLSITDMTLIGKTVAGTCYWVTADGRTDERTLYFQIKYQ